MKKLCTLLLAVLMIVTTFLASCGGNNQTPGTTGSDTEGGTTQGDTAPVTDYEDTIPDVKYDGADFGILVSTQMQKFFISDEESNEVIDIAVVDRNEAVEDRFGINIVYNAMDGNSSGQKAFAAEIETSISSGDDYAYDLVVPQVGAVGGLTLQGGFYNLYNSDAIHWDQPWWYAGINDSQAYTGKLYGAAGAYLMDKITGTVGLFFNRSMMEDMQMNTNIYDLVNNGTWTFDKMNALVQQVSEDINQDGVYDANDKFGFVGHDHGIRAALYGSNIPISSIDDGEVELLYLNNRVESVFTTYFNFFNQQDSVYSKATYAENANLFTGDRALFCAADIIHMSKDSFRSMESLYGVCPMPKYDEQQENYYSIVMRWDLAYIPVNADTERACIVLENLNYETYTTLIPAYWESGLQYKYTRDDRDMDMLNIIRSSITYDFTEYWMSHAAGVYFGLSNLIINQDRGISSWWYGTVDNVQIKLEQLLDAMEELE